MCFLDNWATMEWRPSHPKVLETNNTLCAFSNDKISKNSRNIGEPGIGREQIDINTKHASRIRRIHNEVDSNQLHLQYLLDLPNKPRHQLQRQTLRLCWPSVDDFVVFGCELG